MERNFTTAQKAINFALAQKTTTHISLKTQGIWVTDLKTNVRSFSQTETRAIEIKKMKKKKAAAKKRAAKKKAVKEPQKIDAKQREEIIKESLAMAGEIVKNRGEHVTYISKDIMASLPIAGTLVIGAVVVLILSALGYIF